MAWRVPAKYSTPGVSGLPAIRALSECGQALFPRVADANLPAIVSEARLRSSFIYLANAVHDLTANWRLVVLGLAPLVVVASLCLLPDALNLQHSLVQTLEPGTRAVGYFATQVPYRRPVEVRPLFPPWSTVSLHLLFFVLTVGANLVILCILKQAGNGARKLPTWPAVRAVYRECWNLVLPFYWVAILQLLALAVGLVLLIVPAALAFVWLYFSQYSLVMDGNHSWRALLHSRELERGLFLPVAIRIAVFLAVWSGYNTWAGIIFIGISLALGFVGAITGSLWTVVFAADLISVSVGFLTSFFFLAAGNRLYQDLKAALAQPDAGEAADSSVTGPLRSEASGQDSLGAD